GHRLTQRRLLRANVERIRRVLDVDALEDAAVASEKRGSDVEARVGGVRPLRHGGRALVQFAIGQKKSWKTTSVVSAPSNPPKATSTAEWTPASTLVCATSSAMINMIAETRKRWSLGLSTYVA